MCIVLDGMKKDPNFDKDYKVQVRRVGGGRDQNQNEEPQIMMQVQREVLKDAPQWGFKIFNDANDKKFWDARVDKNSDFQDYDPDQNWQIERHF